MLRGRWGFVIAVWAASRCLFLVGAALAHSRVDQALPEGDLVEPAGALGYWAHWDGAWYAAIAERGYGDVLFPFSTVFFPLYPLAVRGGSSIGAGPALAGVLVSLACCLFALFFVYRIAEQLWDIQIARWSTAALAFFPTALFFNAVYTEALFVALTAGTIWAARVRGNLLLAGLLAGLASATRNVGVLLVIPLAFELWQRRSHARRRDFLGLALVPFGLLSYAAYLGAVFERPLLFVEAQEKWDRELPLHARTIAFNAWHGATNGAAQLWPPGDAFAGQSSVPSFDLGETFGLVCLVFFVTLLVAGLRVLPPDLLAYAAVLGTAPLVFVPPGSPLVSFGRYFLADVPLFFVLGRLLATRRLLGVAWMVGSMTAGVYLTALFATWRWAG